jgi:hypothetical protein
MGSIKQFFKTIDWYKTSLGLMILLVGSLLCVTTLIVPYVREVRKQEVILNVEQTSHDKAKARYEEESKKLADFKKENARIIAGFHNSFDPKAFSNGFGDTTMLEFAQNGNGEDKAYNYTTYDVTAGFNSPRKFFDLLSSLGDASFIAQITYPIVVASKNGTIYSSFGMKTFVLPNKKDKRKPSVEEGSDSPIKHDVNATQGEATHGETPAHEAVPAAEHAPAAHGSGH